MTPPGAANLNQPVELAHGQAWANRYALAPMTNKQSHDDGTLSEAEYQWLVARGRVRRGQDLRGLRR